MIETMIQRHVTEIEQKMEETFKAKFDAFADACQEKVDLTLKNALDERPGVDKGGSLGRYFSAKGSRGLCTSKRPS